MGLVSIFLILTSCAPKYIFESGTKVKIVNDGTITQENFRNSGDYKSYTEITVDGPSSISDNAFEFATSLKNITIKKSVTSIGIPFLRQCASLQYIQVDEENEYYFSDEFGVIYKKSNFALIKVPRSLSTYTINENCTQIYAQALQQARISLLKIPKKVTSLATGIIYDSNVATVEFESGIRIAKFASYCFSIAPNLATIKIPPSVTLIERNCFWQSRKLANVIFEGESGLIEIKQNSFQECTSLVVIIFPLSLQKIGSKIFLDCSKLENVSITGATSSVELDAFTGCSSLKSIFVDDSNLNYTSVNGTLFNKEQTELLAVPASLASVVIPEKLVSIGSTVLQSCSKLVEISIDANNKAFSTDESKQVLYDFNKTMAIAVVGSATDVAFANVQSINSYCCYQILTLKKVTLPQTLKVIDTSSFSMSGIEAIEIPNQVYLINISAFEKCQSLTKIEFQSISSVKNIMNFAFKDALSLTSIVLPASISNLSYETFRNTGLQTVEFESDAVITEIAERAFNVNTKLTTVKLSNNVETLHTEAFASCFLLSSFQYNNAKLSTVGTSAFFRCESLTEFIFGESCKTIGISAFQNCISLALIQFDYKAPITTISPTTFKNCSKLKTVSLPNGLKNIDASVFYQCSSLILIQISSTNTNFQTDEGVLYTYGFRTLVLCPGGKTEVKVNSNTSEFGPNAFYGCAKLRTVLFGAKPILDTISNSAFFECTSLAQIELPGSLRKIGTGAFEECTALSSVIFLSGASLETIDSKLLKGCNKLSTLFFEEGASLGSLGPSALEGMAELKNVSLPSNTSSIGSRAFYWCSSLSNFTIPPSIASVSDYLFYNCTSLKAVDCSNVEAIGEYSFFGCWSLTTITDSPNITLPFKSIGASAFRNSGLNAHYILSQTIMISDGAFLGTSIPAVEYCGSAVPFVSGESASVFNSNTLGIVSPSYPGLTFGGALFYRGLTKECTLIPPSQTATSGFTGSVATSPSSVLIASIIIDEKNSVDI